MICIFYPWPKENTVQWEQLLFKVTRYEVVRESTQETWGCAEPGTSSPWCPEQQEGAPQLMSGHFGNAGLFPSHRKHKRSFIFSSLEQKPTAPRELWVTRSRVTWTLLEPPAPFWGLGKLQFLNNASLSCQRLPKQLLEQLQLPSAICWLRVCCLQTASDVETMARKEALGFHGCQKRRPIQQIKCFSSLGMLKPSFIFKQRVESCVGTAESSEVFL